MKRSIHVTRGVALLTLSAVVCLSAGVAHAQRSGRQGGRAFGRAVNGTTGTSPGTTGTTAGSTTSGRGGGNCPGGTGNTSGTTTGGTGATSATTTGSTALSSAFAGQASSSGISAVQTGANQAMVRWAGDTNNVRSVALAVLNANGQVLQQQSVTQNPVQANLTVNSAARYFGVHVIYTDGTSRTMYSPIR